MYCNEQQIAFIRAFSNPEGYKWFQYFFYYKAMDCHCDLLKIIE